MPNRNPPGRPKQDDDNTLHPVSMRMPAALWRLVKETAKQRGISASELVREALTDALWEDYEAAD